MPEVCHSGRVGTMLGVRRLSVCVDVLGSPSFEEARNRVLEILRGFQRLVEDRTIDEFIDYLNKYVIGYNLLGRSANTFLRITALYVVTALESLNIPYSRIVVKLEGMPEYVLDKQAKEDN